MSKPNDHGRKLDALYSALADEVARLSDKEVLADAASRGADVQAEAQQVRGVLFAGIVKAKKQRLVRAEAEHQLLVESYSRSAASLPADPGDRRALLDRTLKKKPEFRPAVLTLQNRNFEAFSDDDVESVLRHLQHLGALDDDEPVKGS